VVVVSQDAPGENSESVAIPSIAHGVEEECRLLVVCENQFAARYPVVYVIDPAFDKQPRWSL
jgi:hypothetical protein